MFFKNKDFINLTNNLTNHAKMSQIPVVGFLFKNIKMTTKDFDFELNKISFIPTKEDLART